jgi:RND family efflux transporter MFP subunit
MGAALLLPAAAAAQSPARSQPAAVLAPPMPRALAAAGPGSAIVTPAVAAVSAPVAAVAPAQPPVRVLLVPARETTVVSQMVGRVETMVGELGASFREGEPLVEFECGEQHARLKIAQAEHDAARQQHETKLRLHGLDAAGEAEVQLAATAVARASAQIELATQQRTLCRIEAPFDGRVVKLHVRAYQGVAVGQPLIDIVSSGPLKLRINAPSRWVSWLKPGSSFRVQIDETGRTYPATVTALNARVDAVSQSIEIEGTVRGQHPDLLAGMSGNALFAPGR